MGTRIGARFKALKAAGRPGLVTFIMGGDPDMARFETILAGLPAAGADLIEIGMPFSDPMADGPAIQAAGLRALQAQTTLAAVLAAVTRFRATDQTTPIILMGYYNPIYSFGGARFADAAASAGVDGVIIVDLPPEEAGELTPDLARVGLDLIRLTTPTSDERRLPRVLEGAGGFVYHVAIAGITGTRAAAETEVKVAVDRIRRFTDLPVAVGFGIRTPVQASLIGRLADAAVVGTAIVETVARYADQPGLAAAVHDQVRALARALESGLKE